MNIISFLDLLRMIYGKRLPDIGKIQKKGLLAVKIAQHFALRIDFLDEKVCQHLSKLFRNTTGILPENLDLLLSSYVSKEWLANFSEFNRFPFAAASIGQVHSAKLTAGDEVVVKVIKSDFSNKFLSDIAKLERFLKMIVILYPKLKKVFDPIGVLNYIKEYTLEELNLLNEIKGKDLLEKIYLENKFRYDFGNFKFTEIFREISNSKVLVSRRICGSTFDELLNDKKLSYSDLLALFKIHGFYLFAIGIFHGDIHPGNIFLTENGEIYFIDTGAISRIGDKIRRGLFDFFEALCEYDYERCCTNLHFMSKNKLSTNKFEHFANKFLELYRNFKGSSVSEVSLTKKMMETIKLAVNHGMEFEKGMFGVIKSLMYLDGMVLRCKPDAILIEDMRQSIKEFKKILGGNEKK